MSGTEKMRLRPLRPGDAPRMLEWMHDETVVAHLAANFADKTLADCEEFIAQSQSADALHLAVADEADRYMGTVSLKHICRPEGWAEFAITICKDAMGKGYAAFAMARMLRLGFAELHLRRIYWCVSPANVRAVRFYDKQGYPRAGAVPEAVARPYKGLALIWYAVPGKEQTDEK